MTVSTPQEKIINLLNKVTIINSFEEGYLLILKAIELCNKPIVVSFINAHGFNLCLSNNKFYNDIISSDLIFRDGIGMKILYKILSKEAGKNICGTDFIPFLLKCLDKKLIALLGTKPPYLINAIQHESLKKHQVILVESGFLPVTKYIQHIEKSKPELVVLGMGMPKQEELSFSLKENLNENILIINGGAVIDFMGGKIPRAPYFIRYIGLEWMFRLTLEPRRLFNRYIIGNIKFLIHIIKFKRNCSIII